MGLDQVLGLDHIVDKIIEFNVTSTNGLLLWWVDELQSSSLTMESEFS